MEKINKLVEEKREKIKLLKEIELLFDSGALNSDYFKREIRRITDEHNGLIEAYNLLSKE